MSRHARAHLAEAFGLDLADVARMEPCQRKTRPRNGRAQWGAVLMRWWTIAGVVLLVHTAQNAQGRT